MKDHVSKGDPIWCLHVGSGQLIATAVHDGHEVRDEVAQHLALTDARGCGKKTPSLAIGLRRHPIE